MRGFGSTLCLLCYACCAQALASTALVAGGRENTRGLKKEASETTTNATPAARQFPQPHSHLLESAQRLVSDGEPMIGEK